MRYRIKKETKPTLPTYGKYKAVAVHYQTDAIVRLLVLLPVIDYVIIHELCHTLIMKHTVKFETLLNSHCPDYKQAQAWLEKYGNSL